MATSTPKPPKKRMHRKRSETRKIYVQLAENVYGKSDRKRKLQKERGICGAKTKKGTICQNRPGSGTNHLGIGKCRFHGGSTRTHQMSAYKKDAIFLGAPKDINPVEALIWCIKITAGEVEWYNQQLALLDKKEWYQESILGRQLHVLAKERQGAVDRLARYSKDAISLGLAERAIRMAELYGSSLARFIQGVLDDLNLTGEQKHFAPAIVRKHLVLMEGGKPEGGPVLDPVANRRLLVASKKDR